MIQLLTSYYMGQIALAILLALGIKYFAKEKCNIDIQYFKIINWFYKTIKNCFVTMFDTINKFRR